MSNTPITEEMVEAGAKAAWEVREKQSGGTLTWEGVLRRRKECEFTYMSACDIRDQARAAITAALQSAADTPAPQTHVTAGVLLCQDIVDLAIKTLTAAEYLSEEAAQDAVRVRKALRDATATGSALDDLAPNGPVTGNQLREILGLEPEEGLDPDDDGNIRTCAGEWVKNTETGLWAFEEDEDD